MLTTLPCSMYVATSLALSVINRGITLTWRSPEVDQDVLLLRAALASVAMLYRMKADATIRINRSLFKFTYCLQCNAIAVKMYLVL